MVSLFAAGLVETWNQPPNPSHCAPENYWWTRPTKRPPSFFGMDQFMIGRWGCSFELSCLMNSLVMIFIAFSEMIVEMRGGHWLMNWGMTSTSLFHGWSIPFCFTSFMVKSPFYIFCLMVEPPCVYFCSPLFHLSSWWKNHHETPRVFPASFPRSNLGCEIPVTEASISGARFRLWPDKAIKGFWSRNGGFEFWIQQKTQISGYIWLDEVRVGWV